MTPPIRRGARVEPPARFLARRRALTPLFWNHINSFGRFELEMDRQLDLELPAAA
jgi:hypothetical protein